MATGTRSCSDSPMFLVSYCADILAFLAALSLHLPTATALWYTSSSMARIMYQQPLDSYV
jgi:hypothetical protein